MLSFLSPIDNEDQRRMIEDSYIRIGNLLWKIAFKILANENDAMDILHSTFLAALEHMSSLKKFTDNQLDSYLVVIAKNLCYMQLRKFKSLGDINELDELVAAEDNVENIVFGNLDKEYLYIALKKIPPQYYNFLCLKYFLGLSNREIADTLHLRTANVRMIQTRALRSLKKQMNQVSLEYDTDSQ